MRVPVDVKCKVCKKIFCCAECRYRHEVKSHAIVVRQLLVASMAHNAKESIDPTSDISCKIFIFCPICERKPLILLRDMYEELLEHIEEEHLPLRCNKCFKLYTTVEDLQEFSKCILPNVTISCAKGQSCIAYTDESCQTDTDNSKATVTKQLSKVTISTQTSPNCKQNELQETPISAENIQWKAKCKLTREGFISDSVSSIKNISSISNGSLRRSIDAATQSKMTLVRTTSTPLHAELLCTKPTERIFNASGGQVSSIYNSGVESDNSPALPPPITGGSPKKQPLENINRYRKVGGRAKMTAVTPLRQVMSKSIQKAFAEHGCLPTSNKAALGSLTYRKQVFEYSSDSGTSFNSPLDLRLSPVIRRTQSEISCASSMDWEKTNKKHDELPPHMRREIRLSSQKTTTESIVITRMQHVTSGETSDGNSSNSSNSSDPSVASSTGSTANSVYKTCHSVEIITSTTALSKVNIEESVNTVSALPSSLSEYIPCNTLGPITPITRIPGAVINKKVIQFDTPFEQASREVEEEPDAEDFSEAIDHSNAEAFFTPDSTPVPKLESSELDKRRLKSIPFNSPTRRPSIRDCSARPPFGRLANDKDEPNDKDKSQCAEPELKEEEEKVRGAVSRSWSFSELLGRVMRLPSLGAGERKKSDEGYSSTLIKRCASIAGSLVRPTASAFEDPLNNLKRKRTSNGDVKTGDGDQSNLDAVSPNAEHSVSVASKRLRIQARKPIERMRKNSAPIQLPLS